MSNAPDPANVTPMRWRPTLDRGTRWRLVRQTYGERIGNPKLTSREMAALLGVKPGTYAQWEAGNNSPKDFAAMAVRVSKVTGCDPAFLLGITEDGPPEAPIIFVSSVTSTSRLADLISLTDHKTKIERIAAGTTGNSTLTERRAC